MHPSAAARLHVGRPYCGLGEVDSEKPTLLWALYYNMRDSTAVDKSGYSLPSNVYLCTGPDAALGSDHAISQAESVFQQLLPDEEFCPPAPNPEDIVYDGEAPQGEGAGFGEPAQPERGEGDGGEEEQKAESEQDSEGPQTDVAEHNPTPAPPAEEKPYLRTAPFTAVLKQRLQHTFPSSSAQPSPYGPVPAPTSPPAATGDGQDDVPQCCQDRTGKAAMLDPINMLLRMNDGLVVLSPSSGCWYS
ncbi:hypothetical protein JZ751_024324, partial [Albula glossodonta]